MTNGARKGPFCPQCAGIMHITGRTQYGATTYHCPHCNYDSHSGGVVTPTYLDEAIITPPGDPQRCSRCGAFTFSGFFFHPSSCRICGAPDPQKSPAAQTSGPMPIRPQPYVPSAAPAPQQPSWAQQFQPGHTMPYSSQMPGGRTGPGCWGVGLGLLDILVALIIAAILIVTWLGAGGSVGTFDAVTLFVGGVVSLLGIILGIRSMTAKPRAKVWAGLYFLLIPLTILALLMIQGFFY